MNTTLKRRLSLIATLILFVTYFIITDPDVNIFKDLPFGVDLVLIIGIFIVAILGIVTIEFFPDFIVDSIYGKEKELVEKAKECPRASSLVLISKSIRILSYAIILAASIIAYNLR